MTVHLMGEEMMENEFDALGNVILSLVEIGCRFRYSSGTPIGDWFWGLCSENAWFSDMSPHGPRCVTEYRLTTDRYPESFVGNYWTVTSFNETDVRTLANDEFSTLSVQRLVGDWERISWETRMNLQLFYMQLRGHRGEGAFNDPVTDIIITTDDMVSQQRRYNEVARHFAYDLRGDTNSVYNLDIDGLSRLIYAVTPEEVAVV